MVIPPPATGIPASMGNMFEVRVLLLLPLVMEMRSAPSTSLPDDDMVVQRSPCCFAVVLLKISAFEQKVIIFPDSRCLRIKFPQ